MINKTILSNGLTVITEYFPRFPSFSMSYTFKEGSGKEIKENNGIHHLIEHMLFKGSKKFSLKDIAYISDRLGGHLNAYTGKEITQFYLKAVDSKLEEAFRLLTDMVFRSEFKKNEFKKEVDVIVQEINESEDNPDSYAFDLFYRNLFGPTGIGLPIAGTKESVSSMSRDYVYDFYKKKYVSENIIFSCVGNIKHESVLELVNSEFSSEKTTDDENSAIAKPNITFNKIFKERKDLKQLYSIIGFNGVSINDVNRYKFLIFNDILGSGMSSRLFQMVREEKGLAYTVSSFLDSYSNFGIQLIYSILDAVKYDEYFNTVISILRGIKRSGVNSAELERSKDHIKSSLILSLESNLSKMRFNINQEIYFGREKRLKEIISEINSIELDDLNSYLKENIEPENHNILLYGDTEI